MKSAEEWINEMSPPSVTPETKRKYVVWYKMIQLDVLNDLRKLVTDGCTTKLEHLKHIDSLIDKLKIIMAIQTPQQQIDQRQIIAAVQRMLDNNMPDAAQGLLIKYRLK